MTLHCTVALERWPMKEPFTIARETMCAVPVIVVTLTDRDGRIGRGEAAGVDYDGETSATMHAQIGAMASDLPEDLSAADLMRLLPAGGARNALDCALWDLRAKRSGKPVWALAGLAAPGALETVFTIGLGSADEIDRRARAALAWPVLKLKLDARRHLDVVARVRDARPVARLVVDANQAWDRAQLESLLPELQALGVEMIEQPVARGDDGTLDGLDSPIAIVADESCTDRASLPALVGRYHGVSIKLDKCGGLTEGLALAAEARALGLDVMVGNMCGTSLAMAPAFLVGQTARWCDLDGPLLQVGDRACAMVYRGGRVEPPSPALWG